MVGIIDYGVGNLFSLCSSFRAIGEEAFVSVMSTNEEDKAIRLPLGAIGASGIKGDVFGAELNCRTLDDNAIELTVPAHKAYFMECLLK